jgi:VanZ family protein
MTVEKVLRIVGYAAVLLIGGLSLMPGDLRPETGAPGKFEHLIAYLVAGILLGSSTTVTRERWQALWLIPYAGALELIQLFVPDRHSRFSDFVVSALGAMVGFALAFGVSPVLSQLFPSSPNATRDRA